MSNDSEIKLEIKYLKDSVSDVKKALDRDKELMDMYGKHVSNLRLDITEIKGMLKDQNTEMAQDRKTLSKIQPLLDKYDKELILAQDKIEKYNQYIRVGKVVGTTSLIGSGVLWIIKILKNSL